MVDDKEEKGEKSLIRGMEKKENNFVSWFKKQSTDQRCKKPLDLYHCVLKMKTKKLLCRVQVFDTHPSRH